MIGLLLPSLLSAANPGAASTDPGLPEARLNHYLRPEVVQRWERDAVRGCASASSPAECRPAYLSARYSEVAMQVCRDIAGREFDGTHAGMASTFAQHSVRRTCQASIENCRSAWRNYDRINFAGRPSQTDARRMTHFSGFLTETCGAEAGLAAPF